MDRLNILGLEGKTVVILGAGQGIGEASCRKFAQAGANVCLVDLDRDRAERVAQDIRAMGVNAHVFIGDVTKASTCRQVMDKICAKAGVPDAMVTVIGISRFFSALDISEDEWDAEFLLNVKYVFIAAQAFARKLIDAGRPGTITAVGSIDGVVGSPVHAPYGAAKAALIHLVKSLAIEWADHGIRVNCVAAGSILTPRRQETEESKALIQNSMIPMRRSGLPDEVAGPLLFLSSALSTYMTGQTIMADGGWSITNLFNTARSATGMRL